jgi:hypothetical protein
MASSTGKFMSGSVSGVGLRYEGFRPVGAALLVERIQVVVEPPPDTDGLDVQQCGDRVDVERHHPLLALLRAPDVFVEVRFVDLP